MFNMCKLNKTLKPLNLSAVAGNENLISDEGAEVAPRRIGSRLGMNAIFLP